MEVVNIKKNETVFCGRSCVIRIFKQNGRKVELLKSLIL